MKFLLVLLLTLLPSIAISGELEERLKGLLPEGAEFVGRVTPARQICGGLRLMPNPPYATAARGK